MHYKQTRGNKAELTQSCLFNSVCNKEPLVKIIEEGSKLIIKMCYFHKFQEEGTSQDELNEAVN